MSKDVLQAIEAGIPTFSKGQRRIAKFIQTSYDKAAFMTASRLGQLVDVSESTVVRFAAELGYDGYPAMQRALQELIRNKLTSLQRMEVTRDRMGSRDVLDSVMRTDMEKVRLTLEEIDHASFDKAVDTILRARRIYILGLRSASALADFLGFYFNLIFDNVTLIQTGSASETFEHLFRVGPGDVVIGISFPRYSSRTVRALAFAKDRGSDVLAITDSLESPLALHATVLLLAKSDMVSFADSLVAPLSLVNALIVAVGRCRGAEVERTFADLEQIWSDYGVYEKAEEEEA